MPKNTFSWLHLTDFHYGLKGHDCLWPTLREPFLDSLAPLHARCGPWDAVLFTGDFVQEGKSEQFTEMQAEVLDPLWERLRELDSGDAVLLAVPGNHDLYRPNPKEDNAAIDTLLEKDGFHRIETKFWDHPAGAYRRVINDAFAAYSQWWDKTPLRPRGVKAGALPGDFSVTLQCGGQRIGIVGLNTTFLQLTGGDYKGRLAWDARQLHAVCEGGVDTWSKEHDVCLLISHQGPNWLTPQDREQGESEIAPAGRFAVHLFGHQHESDITHIRRGGARNAVHLCQACSVFGMDKFGEPPKTQRTHGYAAGRIEFSDKEGSLRLWPRIATNKTGPWRFIPDHDHAELEEDQGTPPEAVATRSRVGAALPTKNVTTVAIPVVTTYSTPGLSAPHSTLPAKRPFFGRGTELEKIANYLLPEDRSWGVVLDGPGGVGKTALALEAAHRAPAEHFPLKLWFTAKDRELLPQGIQILQDHRVPSYYALLSELGRALGREDIPKALPEERPSLVRHALSDYRALLVLDNLETFSADERRQVFELLNNLPTACRAIVTSRRRTDGSTAGYNLRLDKLEREAADELLANIGRHWEPIALLTQKERDRLYTETSGNPLLLTWTAGQLGRTTGRCRTVNEAIKHLQEAHRLQKINEKNDPLDFIFGDLAETFTREETAVLAALVHFTRPAPIEWLLPLAKLNPKSAETALDGLRDRALLVEDDQAATWLLPPLAARFLRRTCPEAVGASGERLADQAYALAVENGYKKYTLFPTLEAAWPQIAAALPMLVAGNNLRLQTLCEALFTFLVFSGRWDDLISINGAAEAKSKRTSDFNNAGQRAFESGFCYSLRGQSTEVLASAARVATHWKAARVDAAKGAYATWLRGVGHAYAGDYPAAVAAYREVLALWRSLSPKSENTAACLNSLAVVLNDLGELDEAEAYLRESLAINKALADTEGVAMNTCNLADLAVDREEWPEAESLSREALNLAEEIGRRELIAESSRLLAKALSHQGRGVEGLYHAKRSIVILTELRSPDLIKAQAVLEECLGKSHE